MFVSRLRFLLCAQNVSWFRFIFTLINYAWLTCLIGYPLAILQRFFYFKFRLRICIFPTKYLGHFVFEADKYISLNLGNGYRTCFTTQPTISNNYFLKILKLRLRFFPRILILPIYLAHHTMPSSSKYILKIGSEIGMLGVVSVRQAEQWFSLDQVEDFPLVDERCLPNNSKPLVALFLRDADYRSKNPSNSNFNSSDYRDVTAANYVPLAKSISDQFSVVKMGRYSKHQPGLDERYWYDYSVSQDQSDFNDFLITRNSDICITTDSGSLAIPVLFRKKIVQTNLSLFGLIAGPSLTIVTLKDYRCISSGTLLSLKELVKLGVHRITDQKGFENLGIDVIENSPKDLVCLKQEIEELHFGIWRPNRLNKELGSKIQRQFGMDFSIPQDTYFANSWIISRPWFCE